MTYKLSDVVFELGQYWVLSKGQKGYEVYRVGATHSTRCAIIGWTGAVGLERAKAEITRRMAL